jgi:hypothetical protein
LFEKRVSGHQEPQMVQKLGLVEDWTEESTGALLANDRVSIIKECCKGLRENLKNAHKARSLTR